jgi:hypothetical protein
MNLRLVFGGDGEGDGGGVSGEEKGAMEGGGVTL